MKRFLAAILITASTLLPCLAHAQEVPTSGSPELAQKMADEATNLVPVYVFTSNSGEIVGITPIAPNIAVGCAVLPGTPKGSESAADAPPDAACFLWNPETGQATLVSESGAGVEQRIFAGSEFDAATSLSYMGARYYDAGIGRFLSEDPLFLSVGDKKQLGDIMDKMGKADGTGPKKDDQNKDRAKQAEKLLSDPQKLNGYSYALGNPMKYNDPTGNGPELALLVPGVGEALIAAGGAAIAAVAVGVDAMRNGTFGRNNPAPNIFNSAPPGKTNLFPNGLPPNWSKVGKAVAAGATAAAAIREFAQPLLDLKEALQNMSGQKQNSDTKQQNFCPAFPQVINPPPKVTIKSNDDR